MMGGAVGRAGAARRGAAQQVCPVAVRLSLSRTKAQPSSGSDSALVNDVARLDVPHFMPITSCDCGTEYILFGDKCQFYNYQDATNGCELVPASPRSGRRIAGRPCPSLATGPIGGVAHAQRRASDEAARSR